VLLLVEAQLAENWISADIFSTGQKTNSGSDLLPCLLHWTSHYSKTLSVDSNPAGNVSSQVDIAAGEG